MWVSVPVCVSECVCGAHLHTPEHAHTNELNATCWLLQTQGFSHTGFCGKGDTGIYCRISFVSFVFVCQAFHAIQTQHSNICTTHTDNHLHTHTLMDTHICMRVRGHCPLNKIFSKCVNFNAPPNRQRQQQHWAGHTQGEAGQGAHCECVTDNFQTCLTASHPVHRQPVLVHPVQTNSVLKEKIKISLLCRAINFKIILVYIANK